MTAATIITLLQSPPRARVPAGPCDTGPLDAACDYDEAVASAFADFWIARLKNLNALGADSVTADEIDRRAIIEALLDNGVWLARHDAQAMRDAEEDTVAEYRREDRREREDA